MDRRHRYGEGEIYARLRLNDPGPRYLHFPQTVEDEYFEQLTGEKLVTRYLRGVPRFEWARTRRRQEALDCEGYAYAAALRAGVTRARWDSLEHDLTERAGLTSSGTLGAAARMESGRPTRRSNFPQVIRSRWMAS